MVGLKGAAAVAGVGYVWSLTQIRPKLLKILLDRRLLSIYQEALYDQEKIECVRSFVDQSC